MKKISLVIVLIFCVKFSNAQETNIFKRFYINAGTDPLGYDYQKLPPSELGFEYKFKDESSVGLNLYFSDPSYKRYSHTAEYFGLNFTFNHDWSSLLGLNSKKMDLYTGLNLGITRNRLYYIHQTTDYITNENITTTRNDWEFNNSIGGQIGFRYFVTKNIGLFVEVKRSNEISRLNTGVTYRF